MYKMVNIYKITDCNGLIYVGSTRQPIRYRLSSHTYEKNKGRRNCSSHKLDLENCEIEVLEVCTPECRMEREKHYINIIDCVNINKMNGRNKEKRKEYQKEYHKKYKKEYQKDNREKLKEYNKTYFQDNKEKRMLYQKELRKYKKSWDNLLEIDVNIFQ